jgi:hypothetical protein
VCAGQAQERVPREFHVPALRTQPIFRLGKACLRSLSSEWFYLVIRWIVDRQGGYRFLADDGRFGNYLPRLAVCRPALLVVIQTQNLSTRVVAGVRVNNSDVAGPRNQKIFPFHQLSAALQLGTGSPSSVATCHGS